MTRAGWYKYYYYNQTEKKCQLQHNTWGTRKHETYDFGMTHEINKWLESNMVPVYDEEEDHSKWKMDQKVRYTGFIIKGAHSSGFI